nr:immunoglobulin heavy chain junction region [Mus musculus]
CARSGNYGYDEAWFAYW